MSNGSVSLVVPPQRPIGLMVLVLLVDLGLAAAGAVLLHKGLASDDDNATAAPAEQKTESPSASAASAAALAPTAAPADTMIAAPQAATPPSPATEPTPSAAPPAAAPAAPAAAARKDDTKQRDDKSAKASASTKAKTTSATKTTKATSSEGPVTKPSDASAGKRTEPQLVTSVPAEPEDPYQPPDIAREIDAIAGRSKAAFERCEANFGPARGEIKIAFQVRGDGRVINAAAVENSTGNSDLATCLVTVVSSWRVSAHQGAAINMLRPFNYP